MTEEYFRGAFNVLMSNVANSGHQMAFLVLDIIINDLIATYFNQFKHGAQWITVYITNIRILRMV